MSEVIDYIIIVSNIYFNRLKLHGHSMYVLTQSLAYSRYKIILYYIIE